MLSPPKSRRPFKGIVIGLGCFVAALVVIAIARGWI
jgi:hypothetical protein